MKKVSNFKKNINKIETFITDKEWQTIFKIESLNNPKVEIIWNSEVKEILGKEKLESIKIINNQTNKEKELKLDGLFVAI